MVESIFIKKEIGITKISVKITIITPGKATSINIVTRKDIIIDAASPEKYISPNTIEDKTNDGSCAAIVNAN